MDNAISKLCDSLPLSMNADSGYIGYSGNTVFFFEKKKLLWQEIANRCDQKNGVRNLWFSNEKVLPNGRTGFVWFPKELQLIVVTDLTP